MSTLPNYSEIVTVRDEILSPDGLVDVIDLAHLSPDQAGTKKPKKLSQRVPVAETIKDPADFFRMTFPTEDVQQTLYALCDRLTDPQKVSGTVVLTGRYGLGKSHVLLATHHALGAPELARAWAAEWDLPPLELPDQVRAVTRSFIHRTADNLWDVFFEAMGCPERASQFKTYPDAETIEASLIDQPTVLILDELERWFDALPTRVAQGQNLAFLQALSEVADRDQRITLVTSVLGAGQEPAETLRRTKPLELAFRSDLDRQRVLLFRIFADHGDHDMDRVRAVVDAYVAKWREAGLSGLDEYRERLLSTYPFSPEFLDILTKKVPNLSGFQNTRGSLRLLSRLVQHTMDRRPMISSQDFPLQGDSEVYNTLRKIDDSQGEVVRRALGDNYEAVPADLPHKDELFSTILFYSITDPSRPGATEDQILLAALDPGENQLRLKDGLAQLQRLAFNLHRQEDRYLFRTKENPHARINAMASSPAVTRGAWQKIIVGALEKRWKDTDRTVIYEGNAEEIRPTLNQLAARGLCYLISVRALSPPQRLALQNLAERRNLVLLLEPAVGTDLGRKESRYDLRNDERLVQRARRIEACNLLIEGQPAADSAAIYREERKKEREALGKEVAERYGVYVSWNQAGASEAEVDDSWYELGRVDELSANAFFDHFQKEYSGYPAVKARVKALWTTFKKKEARRLIEHFDRSPGEPVPYEPGMVARALRELAREGMLGLQDQSGRTYCHGEAAKLAETDLPRSILIEPVTSLPPEPPEALPVHPAVSAHYDPKREAVVLSWAYPKKTRNDLRWETLVQRHINSQGWETGKTYPVELDRTHETNRYIGDAEQFLDDIKLTPGAWYHYYVFLIEKLTGAEPRAILSQRCDVLIPQQQEPERPDEIKLPAQPQVHKLLTEVEKKVMSSKVMSAESRVRKVELRLIGLRDHSGFAELAGALGDKGGEVETSADLTVTVRGSFSRQQVMDLVRKLPKEDAHFSASLFLQQHDDGGEGEA